MVSNHVSHAFRAQVEAHGVTVAEWVVLRALFERDEIKPSELAARLGLTRGAISKLVDRLVAKQLVSVRADAQDGRAQLLILRTSGRRLVPVLATLADENDARAFGHLSQHQHALLAATLRELAARLGIQHAPID